MINVANMVEMLIQFAIMMNEYRLLLEMRKEDSNRRLYLEGSEE